MNQLEVGRKMQQIRGQYRYVLKQAVRVCLQNISDYSPFGAPLDGRTMQSDFYRRGFNGMEKDDEVKGYGNSYDYGFRNYDPRVGRFLSIDPLTKSFPWNSPFCFAENDVIRSVDLDGLEKLIITATILTEVGGVKIDVTKAEFIAYQLSFSIEYPDGKIEKLEAKEPIIMYENKKMQEGKNSPNALKMNKRYSLEYYKMKSFKDKQIHIISSGKGHSMATFIHPLGTTATSENDPNYSYTIGCKGISLSEKAEISTDGKTIYGDEPFTYTGNKIDGATVPDNEKQNSKDSWSTSYKAAKIIRDLYENNKDKLQKGNNFELIVVPAETTIKKEEKEK